MDKLNIGRPSTIEEAFQQTNRPKVDFSNVPEDLREYFEGIYEGIVITEALNRNKETIDWDNPSQKKWRPWFLMSPARFRLHDTGYNFSYSYAGGGSRLCNLSEEDANYSATTFRDTWKKIQLG